MSTNNGKPELVYPVNPSTNENEQNALEQMADPQKQHEMVDALRTTEGIDYEKVREDATSLVALRKELQKTRKIADYRKIGKQKFPEFAKKFPNFFDSIRTVELNRLDEFTSVMHMMLTKMSDVKNNVLTHTEMRTQVFEKDLADRYYSRNGPAA
jgi:hypothetical protein